MYDNPSVSAGPTISPKERVVHRWLTLILLMCVVDLLIEAYYAVFPGLEDQSGFISSWFTLTLPLMSVAIVFLCTALVAFAHRTGSIPIVIGVSMAQMVWFFVELSHLAFPTSYRITLLTITLTLRLVTISAAVYLLTYVMKHFPGKFGFASMQDDSDQQPDLENHMTGLDKLNQRVNRLMNAVLLFFPVTGPLLAVALAKKRH